MTRFAILAAILTGLSYTAAAAEQKPTFESLDKDSNGKVSVQEATANDALFVAFEKLDGNKDGELTREEFARYQSGK